MKKLKSSTKRISQNEIRRYLRHVRENLYCDVKGKNELIKRVKVFISDYILENPDASLSDLIDDFGTPNFVAENFMDHYTMESRMEYKRAARLRKRLLILLIVVIVICILLGCVLILLNQEIMIVHGGPIIG